MQPGKTLLIGLWPSGLHEFTVDEFFISFHDSMQCFAASEAFSAFPAISSPTPTCLQLSFLFSPALHAGFFAVVPECTGMLCSGASEHSCLVLCPWVVEDFLSTFHLDIFTKSKAYQKLSRIPVLKFHAFLPKFLKVSISYIFFLSIYHGTVYYLFHLFRSTDPLFLTGLLPSSWRKVCFEDYFDF